MGTVLVGIAVVPLGAALVCLVLPARLAQAVTLATGAASFVAVLALLPAVGGGRLRVSFLQLDALSAVFVLATAFLYFATTVHSIGYLRARKVQAGWSRYARLFYAGVNLFAWAMLVAPLVNGLALLWIAIEVTTVVSALLVAIDNTDAAAEAAWKYVLIASVGLSISLLATIVMYYAGSRVLGGGFDLAFAPLDAVAHRLPAEPVRLAFILAVVGFGTKVGWVPLHTWLPDAHSEAPTPVSALLSGALLADAFYAVLRYRQIATATLGPGFPRAVLLAFGLASLALAGLAVFGQRDVKRLLAYSSVEHMGILAVGTAFGTPLALAGVLLQVLAHAAAKGTAFFGAGSLVRRFHTKDIHRITAALAVTPWTGAAFLLAILALSAAPPFGIFRSEFEIVAGGLGSGNDAWAVLLVLAVTLAFAGLALQATRMVLEPATPDAPTGSGLPGTGGASAGLPGTGGAAGRARRRRNRVEPSWWMVAAMGLGLAALLVLGLHPPGALETVLHRGAASLGTGR